VDGCRINGAVNLREGTGAAAEDSPARFFFTGPIFGVAGRLSIFCFVFFGVISSFPRSTAWLGSL
jgi:hypothetical protein